MKESESGSVMSDSLRPPGLYRWWNSPGQNTGEDSLSLLQDSSQPRDQTQVSHIAADLQGKPTNTVVGSLSLLQGIFLTQEQGLLHCRQILYQLSYQGSI